MFKYMIEMIIDHFKNDPHWATRRVYYDGNPERFQYAKRGKKGQLIVWGGSRWHGLEGYMEYDYVEKIEKCP